MSKIKLKLTQKIHRTHSNRFQKVQIGEEVVLSLVEPVTGWFADDLLSQVRHVTVCNVDKLLQRCYVAKISEMESKTFCEHLKWKKQNYLNSKGQK